MGYVCQDTQRAVGGKVEGIALRFHPSVVGERRLYAEDGLHITCCRGTVGSCHHKDSRPRLDAYARRQLATTERDGPCRSRVGTNGIVDHLQGVSVLLVLVAVARYVDDLEHAEDGMCLELGAQCTGCSHTGNDP